MTRKLFVSLVILYFFICFDLSGSSGSEALGSEALISKSSGLGRLEGAGLRCAKLKGAGLGSEALGWDTL